MNWRSSVLLFVFWLGSLAGSPGQSFGGNEAEDGGGMDAPHETAPLNGVKDDAGFFRRNAALYSKITAQLSQLREQYDFHVYLVLESVLVNSNVHSMAARLQEEWVPRGNGLVLVFELDSRALGVGQKYDQDYEKEKHPGQVPSYEMMGVLAKASEHMSRNASPEVFLDELITQIAQGYDDYFKREQAPVPKGRMSRLVLVMVGGAAALGLIGLLAAWLVSRGELGGGRKSFFFPEAEVTERLGAPYGGGEISYRRFGKEPAGKS